jgi:hypothetical protein
VPPDTRQVIVHPPARWSVVVSFVSTVGLLAFVVQQLLTQGSAIESVVSRAEQSGVTFLAGGLLFFVISLYVVRRLSADPTGVPLIFRCIPVLLFIIGFLGVALVGHALAMVDDSPMRTPATRWR